MEERLEYVVRNSNGIALHADPDKAQYVRDEVNQERWLYLGLARPPGTHRSARVRVARVSDGEFVEMPASAFGLTVEPVVTVPEPMLEAILAKGKRHEPVPEYDVFHDNVDEVYAGLPRGM